jgi:hypothetical protein
LSDYIKKRKCYDSALTDAVQKIDRPRLTALHDGSARKLG